MLQVRLTSIALDDAPDTLLCDPELLGKGSQCFTFRVATDDLRSVPVECPRPTWRGEKGRSILMDLY